MRKIITELLAAGEMRVVEREVDPRYGLAAGAFSFGFLVSAVLVAVFLSRNPIGRAVVKHADKD